MAMHFPSGLKVHGGLCGCVDEQRNSSRRQRFDDSGSCSRLARCAVARTQVSEAAVLAMQFPWRVLCCRAAVEVLTEAAGLVEEGRLASFAADSERLADQEWSRLATSARGRSWSLSPPWATGGGHGVED